MLAVLHRACLKDGAAVLDHKLLTALAERSQVTLLTVGDVGDYGNVDIVALAGDRRSTQADEARPILDQAIRRASPESIGLPSAPCHFDAVIGSGWTSGREAGLLRRTLYPSAIVVNALHTDPRGLGTVSGQPARFRLLTAIHQDVFRESDLVFAPGPKAARDARELISEGHATSGPPVHELIPGVTVPSSTRGSTWSGGTFDLLMLCRAEDRNKGVIDVARAVRDLRHRGHDVRLTVRGTPPDRVAAFQASMDTETGHSGLVRVLPFTDDRARLDADIDSAHALIVASENEAYGLVAGECAARGTPFLVARGNGNGFAELLSEPGGIAGNTGHRFVIEDGGTLSANGNRMGTGHPDAGPRHRVLARAIAGLMADHPRMTEHTRAIQRSLRAYTPSDMAQAFAEAVRRVVAGHRDSTRQGPNGRLTTVFRHDRRPTTAPGP
ncbi:glycosyltransferase [Nocardiopsis sp. NPDC049922]|uniref:glycosyltransferase n=1 Tax=Nocardiopsis sp. NPDC049922 TaxID=3155157 RepID=UPI0033E8D7BE